MATQPKKDQKGPQGKTQQPSQQQQKPGTSVTTGEGAAMILMGDKADLSHIKTDQTRGNENVKQDDLVIPRLEVVQALSPALKPDDPGFCEGAKMGDLLNSVTNQTYGREAFIVPVHYTKQWLVWKKRTAGGGFFGAYPSPEEAKDRCEQEGGERGNIEVIDTPTHLCLLVNPQTGKTEEVVLSLPRTKAKVSRAWNSMIKLTGQDRFARVYRVSTAVEKNQKGEFYNFVIAQAGAPNKVLYQRAEALFNQIAHGGRTINMDTKGYDTEESGSHGDSEM